MMKKALLMFMAVTAFCLRDPAVNAATVTWDGTTSGDATWTNPDSNSWTGATFNNGDIAQFLGAGAGTVTIAAGGVSPGSVIVNSTSAYTFTGGAITGSGTTLTKTGSGVLTLTNVNTYTGLTTVSGSGILDVGLISNKAISDSSALFLGTTTANDFGILMGNGLFTRGFSGNATPGANQLSSQQGGFAAKGGVLTLNFGGGGAGIALNTSGYIFGNNFMFGTTTADSKVIVINPININSTGGRTFTVTAGIGGDAATSAELSGIISGGVLSGSSVQIRKQGDGMLILSNQANTFDGSVQIIAGTLSVSKINSVNDGTSSLGSATTAALGTIIFGSSGTTGRLLYTGVGNTSDRILDLAGSTGGGIIDQSGTGLLKFTSNVTASVNGSKTLTLQGSTAGSGELAGIIGNPSTGALSLTKSGTGTWTLSAANTFSGDTLISGGKLALSNNLALQNSAFDTSGAGSMTLSITTPIFGGLKGSAALASVITTGYGSVTGLTLNPGAAASYSYSGVIANGAANMTLTKTGAGAQTLSGVNTYTGGTFIKSGQLILDGGDNRLLTTGPVVLGDTATTGKLVLGGSASASNQTLTSLTTTGLGGSVVGGNATVSTLTLSIASGSSTFAGTLGGAGTNENKLALTVSGPGTLVLTSTGNTYAGLTNIIASGVLDVGTITSGTLSANSGLLLGSSVGGSGIYGIIQGNGLFTRALSNNGTPTANQVAGAAGGFAARGGVLTVNFGGAGAQIGLNQSLYIFGNNFIFGSTTADNKVVLINPINLNNTGANGTRKFTVVAGIGGADATSAELRGVISNSGILPNGIAKEGTGTLVLSAANTYTGPTNISAGAVQIGNGGTTGSLTSSTANGADGSIAISIGAALFFNRSDALLFENLVKGAGEVRQLGTGTTTLTAANTYTGTTTISAGALQLGDGGTSGSLSTSSAISVATGATFAVKQSDTVTQGTDFSGAAITGAGGFTQAGSGTTILSTANTYTGATTVSGGTLQLGTGGTSGSLSTSSAISVSSGATFAVKQSDTVTQGTDFSGAAITGAGSFSQTGSGTTVLTAANTYTGTTTVTAGSLQISSSGRTGTGDVTVQSGGTLLGTGIIQGTNFTAASGSTLYAGDSTATSTYGTLNFTPVTGGGTVSQQGTLVLGIGTANNAGSLDPTFGGNYLTYVQGYSSGLGSGTHDLLSYNTAGNSAAYTLNFLNTSGVLQVVGGSGFNNAVFGQVFNILDWNGIDNSNTPTFGNVGTNYRSGGTGGGILDLPTLAGGLVWDVSQFTTSGIIVVVPEPSRALLLLLGAAGLLLRRRRR